MSDPIEKLTRLGDALEGAPMPLPASEIRARGDRIRRRKHAVIAGASAAAVAAVAVPVVAFTVVRSDNDKPEITPSPTISDPVPAGPLGEANLMTDADAIYPNGGSDWRPTATFEGDGNATASPCQQTSFEGLGADQVLRRDFEFVVTDTGDVEPTLSFTEAVAEFPSAAEAEAAYAEIKGWYDDCLPPGADSFDAGTWATVPVGVDGIGEVQLSTYRPVEEELDPFGDEAWLLETGVVVSGDRIALLTQLTHGQDYNWTDGTPVEQMLPTAAERLVLGEGGGAPGRTEVPGDRVTQIPEDFPLTDGWPEDDGSDEYQLAAPSIDNQAMAPDGDLEGCGQAAEDAGPTDRLTARLELGSTYYARELQLFADETGAEEYWDSIQDAFAVCEAEGGPGYTVERSGDTVALLWSEGIYRSVTIAVRNGNAVFVGIESDEGATDLDTVDRMWVGVAEGQAGVLAELDALLDGDPGASGTVDPTIPDSLPLDVDLADPGADGELHPPYQPGASEAGVELEVCGQRIWPQTGAVDRMWAWASGPEYGDRRELVTFATADAAVTAVETIRVAVQGCRREGTTVWTVSDVDTGYDSVTFHRTYSQGLGHDAIQVTRVGAGVLLVLSYGEGSLADVEATNEERTALTTAIAPSMCVFTEAGCR